MTSLLNLESIRFGWNAQNEVLNISSFSIDKNRHSFIRGPSGSGKSTLLSLIGGVIEPQQGKAILNQIDMTLLKPAVKDKIRADNIGFIFQQFNLIPYLNAYENVLLPCQFSKIRAKNASDRDGSIMVSAKRLLEGFFTTHVSDLQQPVVRLSVGQQQRIAAARALIGSPSLIIADEPTSALDHDNRRRFMDLLLDEADRQNSTLLFVSHDPTLASSFSQVLNMSEINRIKLT